MPTQLHIYDFDKTLFASPEKPDWWTQGWWGRPESLGPPCVPDRPTADWWNSSVVSSAKRSNSDPDVVSILVTGRLVKKFHLRVRDLLRQAGLRFDSVHLAAGGSSTETAKLKVFAETLADNPGITSVEIWEDRAEHIGKFKSFFEAQGLKCKAHLVKIAPHEVACDSDLKLACTVVARHVEARKTQNFLELEKLFNDLEQAWNALPRRANFWKPKPAPRASDDPVARAFSQAAKRLLPKLSISSDSESLARGLKKYERKLRMFQKMVKAWAGADSWAELDEIMDSQGTQSKTAWHKYIDYRDRILGLLANIDAEVEETISLGGWSVRLISAHYHEWNEERVERLRHVLDKAGKALSRVGLGSLAGGKLYAYPTKLLPASAMTSHNALAAYSPTHDHMRMAVEGDEAKLINNIVHELGHRAYFKFVEGRGRTAWDQFFSGNMGDPNIDRLIKDWEQSAAKIPEAQRWRGRFLGYYISHTDKDDRMWLSLLADQLHIKEDFNPYSGAPKKNSVPGLDQLIAKRNEAKVFLYPVTAYSGTNAEELFAETFQALATQGGANVHPLVRHAFKETIPKFRMARTANRRGWDAVDDDYVKRSLMASAHHGEIPMADAVTAVATGRQAMVALLLKHGRNLRG